MSVLETAQTRQVQCRAAPHPQLPDYHFGAEEHDVDRGQFSKVECAELKQNVARLREEGANEHADQLQAFLEIGPIEERREFWKWYSSKLPLLVAIQITPERDDAWVSMEWATQQHLITALQVETGARRAIIGVIGYAEVIHSDE